MTVRFPRPAITDVNIISNQSHVNPPATLSPPNHVCNYITLLKN